MSLQNKLIDTYEILRHIPLQQLVRRSQLILKRKLFRHPKNFAKSLEKAEQNLDISALPITNLHPPHGYLKSVGDDWKAQFLGTSSLMKNGIEWISPVRSVSDQLWRMNLHYFEYLPELEPDIAEAVISDWIEKCPPRNYESLSTEWNSYSISLRLSAWLNYRSNHGQFGSSHFQVLFRNSIEYQANFLASFLETDILGNHIIKNIRALYECSYCLISDSSHRWISIAEKLLKEELGKQILSDGYHFERSPSYHNQVLVDLIQIHSVMPNDKFRIRVGQEIVKMTQGMIDTCHPDGYPAQFNDSGLDMTQSPVDYLEIFANYFSQENVQPKSHIEFPDAGFFGFRSESEYFLIKTGKLGPDELMAHAHGDWGSFEWSIKGERIIVDQGVYEYVPGQKRNLSKSTRSHNTVQVDGMEQASFVGAFRCSHRPKENKTSYRTDTEGFHLISTLQESSICPCTITRVVEYQDQNSMKISDSISGNSRNLCSSFLLHPECEAKQISRTKLEISRGNSIKVIAEVDANCEIFLEPAVWWPNMGHERSTSRARSHSFGTKHSIEFTRKI